MFGSFQHKGYQRLDYDHTCPLSLSSYWYLSIALKNGKAWCLPLVWKYRTPDKCSHQRSFYELARISHVRVTWQGTNPEIQVHKHCKVVLFCPNASVKHIRSELKDVKMYLKWENRKPPLQTLYLTEGSASLLSGNWRPLPWDLGSGDQPPPLMAILPL